MPRPGRKRSRRYGTLLVLVLPSWAEMWRGLELAVLPQLPLTLTNAVIVTASLSRDLFPGQADRASERPEQPRYALARS